MRYNWGSFPGIPEGWMGVDMHVHTAYSDGLPRVQTILDRALRRGIGVAITDHNTIAGAVQAAEKALGVLVIPGIEVSSEENIHLLLYFEDISDLESFYLRFVEPCRRKRWFCKGIGLPAEDILEAAKEFGGFAALAHPYGNGRFPVVAAEIRGAVLSLLDGIEVCNGVRSSRQNRRAHALAKHAALPSIGGSDAHVACACGHVCTFAPGNDAPSFLQALRNGTSAVLAYPFSIREALEDGTVIACRYLWHALHRQPLWT